MLLCINYVNELKGIKINVKLDYKLDFYLEKKVDGRIFFFCFNIFV